MASDLGILNSIWAGAVNHYGNRVCLCSLLGSEFSIPGDKDVSLSWYREEAFHMEIYVLLEGGTEEGPSVLLVWAVS